MHKDCQILELSVTLAMSALEELTLAPQLMVKLEASALQEDTVPLEAMSRSLAHLEHTATHLVQLMTRIVVHVILGITVRKQAGLALKDHVGLDFIAVLAQRCLIRLKQTQDIMPLLVLPLKGHAK